MMETFTTNPMEWSVTGNLIGSLLGNLTDLTGWTGNKAAVSSGTTREIDGQSITFMKVTYTP